MGRSSFFRYLFFGLIVGSSSGFAPLANPTAASRGSIALFAKPRSSQSTQNGGVSPDLSRRAAAVKAAVLAAGGLVAATPLVGSPAPAAAYSIFDQVRAIESANYIGQIGKPKYPPNVSGDPAKHLPQVKVEGTDVTVSVPHVMTEEHFIQFLWLKDEKTKDVVLVKAMPPTEPSPPTLRAKVPSGAQLRPYLFCNLHGLWKGEPFTVA